MYTVVFCFVLLWLSCPSRIVMRFVYGYSSGLLHRYCHNRLIAAVPVHDDIIKWKHFLRYWPFVRGIHRSPVNSTHKGQWLGAWKFSLICTWINALVNNREAGDLRRHSAQYDVIVMGDTLQGTCVNWPFAKNKTKQNKALGVVNVFKCVECWKGAFC